MFDMLGFSIILKMNPISTPSAPAAIGPYSQGMQSNGFLFFSGQIALTPEGNFLNEDIKTQAKQVLQNIDALLTSQGLTKNNVIKTTMFLDTMDDFGLVNEIYAAYFDGHKPARSTIEVARLPLNAKVEIEVIAEI